MTSFPRRTGGSPLHPVGCSPLHPGHDLTCCLTCDHMNYLCPGGHSLVVHSPPACTQVCRLQRGGAAEQYEDGQALTKAAASQPGRLAGPHSTPAHARTHTPHTHTPKATVSQPGRLAGSCSTLHTHTYTRNRSLSQVREGARRNNLCSFPPSSSLALAFAVSFSHRHTQSSMGKGTG